MERQDGGNDAAETERPTTSQPADSRAPGSEPARSAQSTGSLLDDADLEDGEDGSPSEEPKTAAEWRSDWREALANGDEKRLAELKRYNSLQDWAKSGWALRSKLSSGEYKRTTPLPEDATDEEKAKWREDNGIPKAVEEYEIPELDNYEWTEADEPILESLLTEMHAANTPQSQVNAMLGWYGKLYEQQQQAQFEADKADKEQASDTLRTEWGQEFRPNIKLIDRYLNDTEIFPQGFRDLFGSARAADGRLLINKPGVADWLVSQAKDKYGAGAMLYGDAKVTSSNRLEEINKILAADPGRYFKEGLDKEATELRRALEASESKRRG